MASPTSSTSSPWPSLPGSPTLLGSPSPPGSPDLLDLPPLPSSPISPAGASSPSPPGSPALQGSPTMPTTPPFNEMTLPYRPGVKSAPPAPAANSDDDSATSDSEDDSIADPVNVTGSTRTRWAPSFTVITSDRTTITLTHFGNESNADGTTNMGTTTPAPTANPATSASDPHPRARRTFDNWFDNLPYPKSPPRGRLPGPSVSPFAKTPDLSLPFMPRKRPHEVKIKQEPDLDVEVKKEPDLDVKVKREPTGSDGEIKNGTNTAEQKKQQKPKTVEALLEMFANEAENDSTTDSGLRDKRPGDDVPLYPILAEKDSDKSAATKPPTLSHFGTDNPAFTITASNRKGKGTAHAPWLAGLGEAYRQRHMLVMRHSAAGKDLGKVVTAGVAGTRTAGGKMKKGLPSGDGGRGAGCSAGRDVARRLGSLRGSTWRVEKASKKIKVFRDGNAGGSGSGCGGGGSGGRGV
ncbi:uncharacterized protein K452DRAFT_311989 [Aplosporella prunicola CBS 121167]|uniref:Uncharacterized protein n=1 Tax=Aplosporella prunicola CBS 121167 TaxID=1176127 RepID=A0A6A6B107_9PEZI|nr:uncharacterized protein K452DRAFT_311989 [Aplosporella prunicola CBS 121167]KAF2137849.1 hypothetical protein K452DRAFT_311989 [Aplosporella prunicola CBS 121167]